MNHSENERIAAKVFLSSNRNRKAVVPPPVTCKKDRDPCACQSVKLYEFMGSELEVMRATLSLESFRFCQADMFVCFRKFRFTRICLLHKFRERLDNWVEAYT